MSKADIQARALIVMDTYLVPNYNFRINEPIELQVLLKELPRIPQTLIHEREQNLRQLPQNYRIYED